MPALAARGPVPPLIAQFDEGYGLLVGTVASTKQVPNKQSPEYPWTELRFRVLEVLAAPVTPGDWPLKVGGTFAFVDSCGYGGTVEDWLDEQGRRNSGVPPAGTTFLLSVKKGDAGGWQHVHGAGAARPILKLADHERALVSEVHVVAKLAGEARVARCRELAVDVRAREALRVEAIRYLADRCSHAYPPRDPAEEAAREAERKSTAATLRAAWRDPGLPASPDLVWAVDSALLKVDFHAFRTSPERRDVWVVHLFRPMQGATLDDAVAELSRRGLSVLAEIAQGEPGPVGQVVMKQLADPAWPLLFRHQIASVLLQMMDATPIPDPVWQAAWADFMFTSLPKADAFESRVLLAAISYRIGAMERNHPKHLLPVSPELLKLLRDKHDDLALRAGQGDHNGQYKTALGECEVLLKWIDKNAPKAP
jgi:hypothetical protein